VKSDRFIKERFGNIISRPGSIFDRSSFYLRAWPGLGDRGVVCFSSTSRRQLDLRSLFAAVALVL
jgi:hypothetical protein